MELSDKEVLELGAKLSKAKASLHELHKWWLENGLGPEPQDDLFADVFLDIDDCCDEVEGWLEELEVEQTLDADKLREWFEWAKR